MEKIDDEFLIQRLKGHDSLIKTLSFSPNAKYLVSGAFDGNIVIWEISNGNQIHKFKAHDSAVNAIVFTPDGKYIVSGSSDHTVKIWTFPSGKHVRNIEYYIDSIHCVLMDPKGDYIITGGSGPIKKWDFYSGQLICDIEEGLSSPHSLALSPNGRYIAGYGNREYIMIWDSNKGKIERKIKLDKHNGHIINFSPLGKYLIYVCKQMGKTILIRDLKSNRIQLEIQSPRTINSLDISPDGKYLLGLGGSRFGYLWKLKNGNLVRTYENSNIQFKIVRFSPDEKYLVSGSNDGSIHIWAFLEGKDFNYETYLKVRDEIQKRERIDQKIQNGENQHSRDMVKSEFEVINMESIDLTDELNIRSYALKLYEIFLRNPNKKNVNILLDSLSQRISNWSYEQKNILNNELKILIETEKEINPKWKKYSKLLLKGLFSIFS